MKKMLAATILSCALALSLCVAPAFAEGETDAGGSDATAAVPTVVTLPTPSTLVGKTFKAGGLKYQILKATKKLGGSVEVLAPTKGRKKVSIPATVSKSYKVSLDGTTVVSSKFTFNVTTVAAGAFNNAKGHKLQAITFGKNVLTIGKNAFRNCSKLMKITFKGKKIGQKKGKKAYGKMGKNAFRGTPRLCNAYTPTTTSLNLAYKQGTRSLLSKAGFKGVVY